MATRLDFWFDYTCPYAYIANTQVRRLASRMKVELVYQPMLLGGVFQANGTPQTPAETLVASKQRHHELDIARWAALFGVRLHMPKGHPMRSVEALRATIATGNDPHVIEGFYRAYWEEGRPPSDEATIRDVVGAAGHDPNEICAKIATADVKDDLRRRTDRAISLGVFGAPAFVVDDGEIYWGQDRMHAVAGVRVDDVLPPIARAAHGAGDTLVFSSRAPRTLEVYWDFASPFSYLGATQAPALAARTGAKLVWRPMLLGGLFKAIGQPMVPLQTWSLAKQRYFAKDAARWGAYWGVPFKWSSRFPLNSLKAMRVSIAIEDDAQRDAFRAAAYRAAWADDRDIADDAVLAELIATAGAEPAKALARAQSVEVKQALVDATTHAANAGVFGAPTWVVNETELFWGQDRIALVERALVGCVG